MPTKRTYTFRLWAEPGRAEVTLERYDVVCRGLIFTSPSKAEALKWLAEMTALCA